MANRLGISIPAYSKLEKRGGNISIDYIVRIAEILEVPRSFIVEFDEDKLLASVGRGKNIFSQMDLQKL
jgi:transcriptional regulator with XRE-family HTH domain